LVAGAADATTPGIADAPRTNPAWPRKRLRVDP
jgi:hypothetical protein